MIKDIIVHTEKEFLEALKKAIEENTLIIFDDGEPIKIDARDFENLHETISNKKWGYLMKKDAIIIETIEDYYKLRLKMWKSMKKAIFGDKKGGIN